MGIGKDTVKVLEPIEIFGFPKAGRYFFVLNMWWDSDPVFSA